MAVCSLLKQIPYSKDSSWIACQKWYDPHKYSQQFKRMRAFIPLFCYVSILYPMLTTWKLLKQHPCSHSSPLQRTPPCYMQLALKLNKMDKV